jgi:hypothetical protein
MSTASIRFGSDFPVHPFRIEIVRIAILANKYGTRVAECERFEVVDDLALSVHQLNSKRPKRRLLRQFSKRLLEIDCLHRNVI